MTTLRFVTRDGEYVGPRTARSRTREARWQQMERVRQVARVRRVARLFGCRLRTWRRGGRRQSSTEPDRDQQNGQSHVLCPPRRETGPRLDH